MNTYYDYRVIKESEDRYSLCEVHYNENKEPVYRSEPIEVAAGSAADLSTMLIYLNRALTEPVIDATIFDNMNPSVSTDHALDILRKK